MISSGVHMYTHTDTTHTRTHTQGWRIGTKGARRLQLKGELSSLIQIPGSIENTLIYI